LLPFAARFREGDDLAPLPGVTTPMLFADRFFVGASGQAVDLGIAEPVWIKRLDFTDYHTRDAWLSRAAALSSLSHPHLVTLADFGVAGTGYFEAWCCHQPPHAPWRRRDTETATALQSAVGLLSAHGIDAGRLCWSHVLNLGGRLAFWPGGCEEQASSADTGADVSRLSRMLRACGDSRHDDASRLRTGAAAARGRAASRDVVDLAERLAEVLDAGVCGRPRGVRFVLPVGVPRTITAIALARCARLHGYVPVAARLLGRAAAAIDDGWRAAIDGRHVVVLQPADEGLAVESGMFFLSLGLGSDRPHVLLTLGSRPQRSRAHASSVCRPVLREESAPYSTGAVIEPWPPTLPPATGYPEGRPRALLDAAASGRHAQVERWLREALGRCARRRDDSAAGEAALALGRLLLLRGRLADAPRMFVAARHHFELARLTSRALCAGVFSGLALTDGGQFSDAESALRAAAVAATSVGDDRARSLAMQALARCLIWEGRFEEAIETLNGARASPVDAQPLDDALVATWRRLGTAGCARERLAGAGDPPRAATCDQEWPIGAIDPAVAHACLVARAGIGMADLAAAGRATAEARAYAAASGRPGDLATACRARALLFLALRDVAAARDLAEEGLEAARRAHDPMRVLRLRLLLAEALQMAGRTADAQRLLARLARLDSRRLPAVVGRPLERLLRGDIERRPDRPVTMAPIQASTTGGPAAGPPAGSRSSLTDAVIDVLGICQAVEDEREALRKVAGALRGRLRAASVSFVAGDDTDASVIVSEGGGRAAEGVGLRAIESGLVIPPSSSRTGLEAAVPARFAGVAIGAVACRWSADALPDWAQAGALLAAASAAVAPCLRALIDRRSVPAAVGAPGDILGVSEPIRMLRGEIARAASAPFNVVIEGESGSGKELVARAIHRLGSRGHRPLCALNCAALTDELIEAELFGHARGAFTGAVNERKGLFEEAHQGTLVLDEVGELTPRAQAKLLRVIQEGEVRRLGENLPRAVDVRIVAATNRPLRAAVEAGAFRLDLLYRLEVIRIAVPPLRARVEDIPVLAAHFWVEASGRVGSRATLAPATLAALARYEWPGNVRELQNVMSALAVSAGRRGSVGPDRLPAIIGRQAAEHANARNLDDARRVFESAFVRAALARAGGRRAQAAADLGLSRQGLAKLMNRLEIE
jgi:DNA-binding NtrC family response regulator/tetratricopeptide (TPR) repeat protein